jgi:hypothetical protein
MPNDTNAQGTQTTPCGIASRILNYYMPGMKYEKRLEP